MSQEAQNAAESHSSYHIRESCDESHSPYHIRESCDKMEQQIDDRCPKKMRMEGDANALNELNPPNASNGDQLDDGDVLKCLGITQSELDAAVKVGKALSKNYGVYEGKGLRELRKAWGPMFARKAKECYNKPERSEQAKVRRDLDKKMLETRRLRMIRKKQFEALLQNPEQGSSLMIPDGAVDDGTNTSFGQAGGVENVPLVLQDKGVDGEDTTGKPERMILHKPRKCYVCKAPYWELHQFYDQLCMPCAELNWEKRIQKTDMTNKVVLLTGGRVKIGFHTALRCLRMGATVHLTSRFVADTALRFRKEADFESWKDNLTIYGLDFRDIRGVERFAAELSKNLPRLDVIINNACQTIRRPPVYYRHLYEAEAKLMDGESLPGMGNFEEAKNCINSTHWHQVFSETNSGGVENQKLQDKDNVVFPSVGTNETAIMERAKGTAWVSAARLSQVCLGGEYGYSPDKEGEEESLFPKQFDVNGSQLDLRGTNSWVLTLSQVSTPEIVEVLTVNTVAPMILNARLKDLMVRTKSLDKEDKGRYIINVSAMEGKFYRHKNANHPHTNMAKAALNMMTRTSASEYAKDGIYMNSVDTGWINDENPLPEAQRIWKDNNFQTPIDEIDAAARLLDPVISGMNGGDRFSGLFIKDYRSTEW